MEKAFGYNDFFFFFFEKYEEHEKHEDGFFKKHQNNVMFLFHDNWSFLVHHFCLSFVCKPKPE